MPSCTLSPSNQDGMHWKPCAAWVEAVGGLQMHACCQGYCAQEGSASSPQWAPAMLLGLAQSDGRGMSCECYAAAALLTCRGLAVLLQG